LSILSFNNSDIIVFHLEKHLADRLKSRYDINFYELAEWTLIKNQIILNFLENDYWSKCSSKQPY
jgi:hypothetical protein